MFDILGLDWGSKVFGVAFGSSQNKLIIPSKLIYPAQEIWKLLEEEIKNRKIQKIVVGLPLNFKLGKTEVTIKVESFLVELGRNFPNLEVFTINERSSNSKEIPASDLEHNLAAQNILEFWLYKTTFLSKK